MRSFNHEYVCVSRVSFEVGLFCARKHVNWDEHDQFSLLVECRIDEETVRG